jgi:hypothetical protein
MNKSFLNLAAIAALFVAGAQGMAADAPQEKFESYAVGVWSPPTSWKLGPKTNNAIGTGLVSAEIMEANGIVGKYLRITASGWNGKATWNAALDKVQAPKQLYEVSFRVVERVPQDAVGRWTASLWFGPDYWDNVASLEFKESAGAATAVLSTAETVQIPGGTEWKIGDWQTVQVELDYAAETVRARFGPAGGKFGDWTKPIFLKQTVQCKGVDFNYNGTVDTDNLSIQPVAAQ